MKALYKPGGTAILTQQPLCHGITTSNQESHGIDRWSYVTISGRDKLIISIISAYRICDTHIQTAGSTTNTMKQWKILEVQDEEHESIRNKNI